MPKDWDIDRDKLSGDILQSVIQNKDFPFSRTWDMLNTYMRDHINLDYGFTLVNKETWGNIYKPQRDYNSIIKYRSSRSTKLTRLYITLWCKSQRLYGQNTL
jgi:hypothetical protein